MMKPPMELFPQDLKILTSVIVIFRVLTQLFLPTVNPCIKPAGTY